MAADDHLRRRGRMVSCRRCGCMMLNQAEAHLVEGAPCRDCREVLVEMGDAAGMHVWSKRHQAKTAA